MTEPAMSCLPREAAEYVSYPADHPHAGQLRVLDLGTVLFAIVAVQILVFLYTRKRPK